jgi:hypothetical protein
LSTSCCGHSLIALSTPCMIYDRPCGHAAKATCPYFRYT